MKVFFFAFGLLFVMNNAFAAKAETLFTCDGKAEASGESNVFTVKSTKSGKWRTTFSKVGTTENSAPPQPLEVIDAEEKDSVCTYSFEQTIGDKKVPMKLIYEDMALTLKGKKGSAFDNVTCEIKSSDFRKLAADCKKPKIEKKEIESNEEANHGILCDSKPLDRVVYRVSIEVSADGTTAKRTIYRYKVDSKNNFLPDPVNLGTRKINLSAVLPPGEKTNASCIVNVSNSTQTDDQVFKMVLPLKMEVSEDAVTDLSKDGFGTIRGARIKTDDGVEEIKGSHTNMTCKISEDFHEKLKNCDIDTAVKTGKPKSKGTEEGKSSGSGGAS